VSGTGDAAEVRNETMLLLGDLIGFPTVTDDSNLGLIAHAERLRPARRRAHAHPRPERRKANLFATIGPPVDGGVVLSGHTDVVPAEEEGWTGRAVRRDPRGQRIYGRGAADMKGFIACALAMAPRLRRRAAARPVHLALTFDEEVGCRGAPLLLASSPRPARARRRRSSASRRRCGSSRAQGLPRVHHHDHRESRGTARRPRKGVNAVEYGARYVDGLLALAGRARRPPPRRRAPSTRPRRR
jgi:acetylornithine deacetylase